MQKNRKLQDGNNLCANTGFISRQTNCDSSLIISVAPSYNTVHCGHVTLAHSNANTKLHLCCTDHSGIAAIVFRCHQASRIQIFKVLGIKVHSQQRV